MDIYASIAQNAIELPPPTQPKGHYGMTIILEGKYLCTAGTGCAKDGKPLVKGLLGKDVTVEEGQKAACQCAKNVLANAQEALGSLNKIAEIIKSTVYIASTWDFTQHSAVGDGASELFKKVFGPDKIGVRSAIGVQSLPMGQAVEIEVIFALKDSDKDAD